MATVNTVLGPLDTTRLGFTLMHEHLVLSSAGIPQNYPEVLSRRYKDLIVKGLIQAKEGGVNTVVDATTLDLGRDVALMAEVSRATGVNIIAVTGYWHEVPRFFIDLSPDHLAPVFIREIREGVAGTGVKAGVLKAASEVGGVTPAEEIVLRGVARAHLQTNVPIMLHSYSPGQVARRQLEVLREEGVNLGRVKVDHANDTTDVEYLTWIIDQGCYLGMDRNPGRGTSPSARIRTTKALIDAGRADRLLLSHDWALARTVTADETRPRRPNPHGYLYVKEVVFKQLREMGVSQEVLDRISVDNPRRFFEGS
ncbi:MAG: phosphotriesterase-related protein [Chloroflexi bacterium]|nr:phosphotriesterase-related protein [Chloroflexota bacterium]